MKLPHIRLSALPLAATIAIGCFSASAHAQSAIDQPLPHGAVLDQCRNLAAGRSAFQIIFCNTTDNALRKVGAYGGWPLGDISGLTSQQVSFGQTSKDDSISFAYAANYEIGNTGQYIQVAAAWSPKRGIRRINLCGEQAPADGPALRCYQSMERPTAPPLRRPLYGEAKLALMQPDPIQWVFWVK